MSCPASPLMLSTEPPHADIAIQFQACILVGVNLVILLKKSLTKTVFHAFFSLRIGLPCKRDLNGTNQA